MFFTCRTLQAQQVADTTFQFANPDPIFAVGSGPRACIDGGRGNFHTIDGRYRHFADLARGDGFEVSGVEAEFPAETIADYGILVIANPLAEDTRDPACLPQRSAFSTDEIDTLVGRVRDCGGLFLIVTHAGPGPLAISHLFLGL
ncbi:MAG: hypothetical protein IIA50_01405 [Bacteroidetes bacterium]|nr:hypothetical protein [Bacteroidota bacterium]